MTQTEAVDEAITKPQGDTYKVRRFLIPNSQYAGRRYF
jgi:hypothetical protein